MVGWIRYLGVALAAAAVLGGCRGADPNGAAEQSVGSAAVETAAEAEASASPATSASPAVEKALRVELGSAATGATDAADDEPASKTVATADSLQSTTAVPSTSTTATTTASSTTETMVSTTAPTTTVTTTTATSSSTTAGTSTGNNLDQAEQASLVLLNELRRSLGLGTVEMTDSEMSLFARSWSKEMRESGFRHSTAKWSENIVWYSADQMTPSEAAAQFHDMWVNSPGHYRNMTTSDWTVVGIGFYHDESGWWGTHVFR